MQTHFQAGQRAHLHEEQAHAVVGEERGDHEGRRAHKPKALEWVVLHDLLHHVDDARRLLQVHHQEVHLGWSLACVEGCVCARGEGRRAWDGGV